MTKTQAAGDPALAAFGQKVREAREKAGKGVQEFAEGVEISRFHLWAIEAGRERASNAVYWRLANALDIDPTEVLRDQVAS